MSNKTADVNTYRLISKERDKGENTYWENLYKNHNKIFRPKDPFYKDIKKYEIRFRGGNIDSIQGETSEDVGANPTSSTKE